MKILNVFALVSFLSVMLCAFAYADQQLPVMGGTVLRCDQGNDGSYTHHGKLTDAWDFNLITGGDTDLGLPVVAVEAGRVVYAKDYDSSRVDSWGPCVILQYRDSNGTAYGLYAHLQKMFVVPGEFVFPGQVIGLLGNADGYYDDEAHIHYQRQNGSTPDAQSIPSTFYGNLNPQTGSVNVSQNVMILDRAYDLFGSANIGTREYDMWDINKARSLNPHHPWYSAWNPSDLYRSGGIPRNCYIQHLNGGTFWDSAIVYDALGGARQAYVLHSGFWVTWTNRGGPLSSLGMPITNEYTQGPPDARQDFLTKTQHRRCDGCGQKTY